MLRADLHTDADGEVRNPAYLQVVRKCCQGFGVECLGLRTAPFFGFVGSGLRGLLLFLLAYYAISCFRIKIYNSIV